jgi:hypothetical protein
LASGGCIEANQGVDFEVCKMEVNVDGIEADEEIDEGILLGRRDCGKERLGDLLARGEFGSNGNLESGCLSIDITDIDTTFMREEDFVTLALGVYANIILGV